MIVDALELEEGAPLEFDVCVIGAGPAGIALVRELMGHGLNLCLVESGGTEHEPETQELARLGTPGIYPDFEDRRRQFGGNSNVWGGAGFHFGRRVRYLPLFDVDFENREGLPYSGWPFSRGDLDPFYARAHELCGIGPFNYDVAEVQTPKSMPLPVDPEKLTTTVEWFGDPDLFNKDGLELLRARPDVSVLLHANAGELVEREGSQAVSHLRVDCLDGRGHDVRAKLFVLSTGAIENTRILLQSDASRAGGLGNDHDLVGRYFMDHWRHNDVLIFEPKDPKLFNRVRLYDIRRLDNGLVMGCKLNIAEQVLREQQLLGSALMLLPLLRADHMRAVRDVQRSVASLKRARLPAEPFSTIARLTRSAPSLLSMGFQYYVVQKNLRPGLAHGWSDFVGNHKRFGTFSLQLQLELAPDFNNRIFLTEERDRLGRKKAGLEWKLGELDLDSLRRSRELYRAGIESAGLGKVTFGDDDALLSEELTGTNHFMGTTRMDADPKQGVVDANCRVHSVDNLYVAGSSVFPTGGYQNCTLTIVALAIRLADHLKLRLQP